ncbi:hypothetical protein GCM10022402_11380 [Salinactinospora qingdaonensis]|uniref:MYXO-CTERM domain-containing protein n=2 Tax=Salinactinospora qingdaonensis TaxID=702744 RepID=A0ABP7F8S3_9ACTN
MRAVWGAVWLGAALVWIGLLAVEWYLSGPTACPLTSETPVYGTAQWSWWPPGRICVWELSIGTEEYTITDHPSHSRLAIPLLLLLWGASLLTLRHRAKKR